MKVAVIGARGMLGTDFMEACGAAGLQAFGFDQPEIDVTDYQTLLGAIPQSDWIINCAAYTNVDGAEKAPDDAFAVNAKGARNLARLAVMMRTPLLHISTDYVFDGHRDHPYTEWNRPNPINIYGASKLAGEQAIRGQGCEYIIVRTQSLFGRHGPNFVKTIARRLTESDDELRVVSDQVSSPTYTGHLSIALLYLLKANQRGIVHISASGECSWYEFACAIANKVKPTATIMPVRTEEFPRPATRPPYSVLDHHRFRQWTSHIMPTWREGLEAYLQEEGYET